MALLVFLAQAAHSAKKDKVQKLIVGVVDTLLNAHHQLELELQQPVDWLALTLAYAYARAHLHWRLAQHRF